MFPVFKTIKNINSPVLDNQIVRHNHRPLVPQYQFDSTSAKEAWIFKYLYLCNLEVPEIYGFCEQYMDRQYHVFRTRRTTLERIKRIQYEINLALARNTFPKTIKYGHKNMGECN